MYCIKHSQNISSIKCGQHAHPDPVVNRCRDKSESYSEKGVVACTLKFTSSQIFIQAMSHLARYSLGKNQEQDITCHISKRG